MYQLKVLSVEKNACLTSIVVTTKIVLGKKAVDIRKLEFPIEINKEDLELELKKYIDTYNSDAELAKVSKDLEAKSENADKLAEEFQGTVI